MDKNIHFVYIARCCDNTLYTGYTIDVSRRILEHNSSDKGAKYTKTRRPVELVFTKEFATASDAKKYEAEIKKMSRQRKIELITEIGKKPSSDDKPVKK